MIIEIQELLKEYNISEKVFLTWVRSAIRSSWGDSPMKRYMEEKDKYLIDNTNPRSMKRFPKVWKRKCNICGNEFSPSDMELDHIKGENSLKSISEINQFAKNTLIVLPKDLQWLCIDKYKVDKGKKVLIRHGCHQLKTYSERYKVSFEEAVIHKHAIDVIKNKQDKVFFENRELEIPSNVEKRKEEIIKILLKEIKITNDT